jgi:Protein of unknown function (DUF3108)
MNALRHQLKRCFVSVALIALLASLTSTYGHSLSGAGTDQSNQHHSIKQKIVPPALAKEQPMPFRAGETLTYRVSWSAFSSAASLQLSAAERRDLFGWSTWHFQGVAHTLGSVRSIFELDDQFDSYTDAVTLESRQFEAHLNEMGKMADQVSHLAVNGQTSRAPTPRTVVQPGTRDPLGQLYALRGMDWQASSEIRVPVYDGHDIYEMRAQRDAGSETVRTGAGTFSAARVSIRVFQYDKEITAIRLTLWIANDAARTPVVIQAALPFGNIRAELMSAL